MAEWVLIIWIGYNNGLATARFDDKAACEQALLAFDERAHLARGFCVAASSQQGEGGEGE